MKCKECGYEVEYCPRCGQEVSRDKSTPVESPPPDNGKGECESLGKVGEYNISKHPPIPRTNQVNVLWIQKDDGEGMSLDLDKLWKDF